MTNSYSAKDKAKFTASGSNLTNSLALGIMCMLLQWCTFHDHTQSA